MINRVNGCAENGDCCQTNEQCCSGICKFGNCESKSRIFEGCPSFIYRGGWKLVRRVGPSNKKWHPANDELRGTAVYGTFIDDSIVDSTFSKKFSDIKFNQFLFTSGDCTRYLITSKQQAIGSVYGRQQRHVCRSNINPHKPSLVDWYNRAGVAEDPWISTIDHNPAINAGELVYGENNFDWASHTKVLAEHNGANVYIRYIDPQKINVFGCEFEPSVNIACSKDLVGNGWTFVRRVSPKDRAWHPARDNLVGSSVYGNYINDDKAPQTFSQKFDIAPFNQYLVATGDCSRWVITSKSQAIGQFYSNQERHICASSKHPNKPSMAKWFNRAHVAEDPWISTIDHYPAIKGNELVYGEAGFNRPDWVNVLINHNGANVYIRNVNPDQIDSFGCSKTSETELILASNNDILVTDYYSYFYGNFYVLIPVIFGIILALFMVRKYLRKNKKEEEYNFDDAL